MIVPPTNGDGHSPAPTTPTPPTAPAPTTANLTSEDMAWALWIETGSESRVAGAGYRGCHGRAGGPRPPPSPLPRVQADGPAFAKATA